MKGTYFIWSIIIFLIFACQKDEPLGTGGVDVWAEQDYATVTYVPSVAGSGTLVPFRASAFRPGSDVMSFIFWSNEDFYLTNEILAFMVRTPEVRCYKLQTTYHGLSDEIVPTAYLYTALGGDAGTEEYRLFDSPSFQNEICFTGISSDRKRYQGTFNLAMVHDTLGPPIYRDIRPDTLYMLNGTFQISMP